jgi:predicted amidohydrolase YtcJ
MAARLTTYVVVAIVAVTLIAGLIVGAQRDDRSGPVDLIIHHARVYTADAHGTIADAIAIRGNKILHVGSDRDVMRYRRPQTQVIDAKGAAVLPGFDDAHARLIAAGLARGTVDLAGAQSADEILQRIGDWAAAHPEAPWIIGHGWSDELSTVMPARASVDRIVAGRPAVFTSRNGTAVWANSAALRLAGVSRRSGASADIVRDRHNEPTGVLRGAAADRMRVVLPKPDRNERRAALSAALLAARQNGVTSVHEFAESAADLDLYDALRGDDPERRLARVYLGVPIAPSDADPSAGLEALAAKFPDDPLVKSGFAYLTSETSQDALNRAVAAVDGASWQVAVSVTDAAGVSRALDALHAAAGANPKRADRRDRLEGIREIRTEDLARLQDADVVTTLLPDTRPNLQDLPIAPQSPSLDVIASPLESLERAGAHLAFGADGADRIPDPHAAIAAVVTRSAQPDEALTLKSAINAWTSGAAWASFDEHRKGQLASGMLADFVVLSADIFKDPAASLPAARVDMTVFDGKIVYRRHASS